MSADNVQAEVAACMRNVLNVLEREFDSIVIDDDDNDTVNEQGGAMGSYFLHSANVLIPQETSDYVTHSPRSPISGQDVETSYGVVYPTLSPFADRTNQTISSFPTPLQIVSTSDVKNEPTLFSPQMIGPLLPTGGLSNRIICPQGKNSYSEPEVYASRLHKSRINSSQRLADFLIKEKLNLQKQILEKSNELHALKFQVVMFRNNNVISVT